MTSYTTLHVENFKGIREMTLEGLGMVNVFVGGNNVGKTSVLQALAINNNYSSSALLFPDPSIFLKQSMIHSTVEGKDYGKVPYAHLSNINWNYLIFRSNINFNIEDSIYKKWGRFASTKITTHKTTEVKNTEYSISPTFSSKYLEEVRVRVFEEFNQPSESEPLTLISMYDVLPDDKTNTQMCVDTHMQKINYLTSNPLFWQSLAPKIFALANRWGKKKLILSQVSKIEKKINDIVYDENGDLMITLEDFEQPIPLVNMGEGFIKLLGIAGILTFLPKSNKGQTLFIDEIENGFHYSVQEDMWRMVLEAAKNDGTQFFFTTHSYEVLESLNAMTKKITAEWEQAGDANYQDGQIRVGDNKSPMEPVCVFKLMKDETDCVTPIRYPKEDLDFFTGYGEELR
jgi:AAA15 family ATPase/GTPase